MQIKWWFFFYHIATVADTHIYHIKDLEDYGNIVLKNIYSLHKRGKQLLRQSKQTENERKIAMQADTLNAVVLALRCRGSNHGKRMKGIAQGLLQASQTYGCFTKQEQTAISNILDRV